MYSRKGLWKGSTHLQSAYKAMRSHRPTKKNPLQVHKRDTKIDLQRVC